MLNKKEAMDEKTVLLIFFYVLLVSALSATIFDLSVTMHSIYTLGAEEFIASESNILLTWGVSKNVPLLINPSIILQLLMFGLAIDIFNRYKKVKTAQWGTVLILTMFLLVVITAGHLVGGFSWFYR